jgi:long-chain acyl-CoA synthetase
VNVARHVERGAADFPDRVALRHAGNGVTYGELNRLASALARHLCQVGVRTGDRVAITLPNRPEFVIAYLATLKLGAIAVTLNARLRAPEQRHVLTDSGSCVLVSDGAGLKTLRGLGLPALRHTCSVDQLSAHLGSGPVAAEDLGVNVPAVIVYTSGTTGDAKGCVLSHGNVVSNIVAKVDFLELMPDDRLLLFVPLSHCFGQNAILNAGLQAGATIVLDDGFSPSRTIDLIARERPSRLFGTPTVFATLADFAEPGKLDSVTYYFSAAAPLPPTTALRFEDTMGHRIHQGYGLTETSPFATYNHRHEIRLGSVGTPITDVSVRIVDPDSGTDLGTDQVGEVVVRGPNVMLGYWGRPDETAARLRQGWLHTGDIGRVDQDGYLYLIDRLDDRINVAGQKVYPAEVEAVLTRHPGVCGAAAYAVTDAVFGQRVAATVVLAAVHPARPDDLLAVCRSALAPYKVPVRIDVSAELPVSPTGKVLRRELRATSAPPPSPAGR